MEPARRTQATAFGLDIVSDVPLWFLGDSAAAATGRTLSISSHVCDSARSRWGPDGELICDERLPDGGVNFRIETDPQRGYLIHGPEYGAHLLSADGRRVECFPEAQPEGAWQRLLLAQVLPFAALLQGLEVLHASAVAHAGSAVALLGPSRSGKTSLALELCRRGATFLADDVLALESQDGTLYANPGSPVAGVEREQPEVEANRVEREQPEAALASAGSPTTQVVAVNTRERMLRMSGAGERTPLGTLFFLDRRLDGPDSPRFAPSTDARMLLASTFNFVLATPERLRGLLDVCALAARLRVETIESGPATSAAELAAAIECRLPSAA